MRMELPPFLTGEAAQQTEQLRDYLIRTAQMLNEEDLNGQRGEKGEKGDKGEKGERGEKGEAGRFHVFSAVLPTTGWTAADYGCWQSIRFEGAEFAADALVLLDADPGGDTQLREILDAWACVLTATPQTGTAEILFKLSDPPAAAIPVRAAVW